MRKKNYPITTVRKPICHFIFVTWLCWFATLQAHAQIYSHNFGTTAITAHPYVAAPVVFNSHLSNSSWSNSLNAWTSTAGATGEAIRLTSTANATITLTFNVAPNFQAEITSFDFWRQRSNLGPQNWSMTINGTNVGSGTTGIAGAALGNTAVANAVTGLTGTVTVVISLTGSTGNGTFRLDDFVLNGTVTSSCTGATINSFTPLTGPQNTLVTINGSGFLSGSGTSSVKFNGVSASFTVVSDSVIKAYVPAGNATGGISVTTNGCEGFAAVNFTELVSVATANYSTDIYISEIYDAQAGDGGIIEIYNGTANPINLAGYTIRRYGDIGGGTFYTINLTGIIPPGGIFLVGIGTGAVPCSITENQHYGTGFNSNDEFELYNGPTLIDNVHAPVNVGYSVIRNPTAVAPKPVFNSADWNTSTTEDCANIGIHNVPVNSPPAFTSPVSSVICGGNSAVFTVSLANPSAYAYQWKTLNASGSWVNVPNAAPYSGANTATLTINPAAVALDDSQYYCQVTSSGANVVSHAAQLEVTPVIVPDFLTALALCNGETALVLNSTSPNGITGTWNPAIISNTVSGNYTFTPNAGQCATSTTLVVTITNSLTPDFATTITLCAGAIAPVLQSASPNGITGNWLPATIDNTTSGNYTFTPNAGQCAANLTLNVTVNPLVAPDFVTAIPLCNGETAPILNNTSPNGISGTWNPATISNTVSGNYIFTPNPGQCAANATLSVTVNPLIVPDFNTTLVLCNGSVAPVLNAVSPNGISGTWNPAIISNTTTGNYLFTPNVGQCAANATLSVTVNPLIVPDFNTTLVLCNGSVSPLLNAVSPNGISGTWNPAIISNTVSGNYTFTPNPGQCAANAMLSVTVNPLIVPDFNTTLVLCNGSVAPVLNAVSPNGITGTWNPAIISNTVSGNYIFTSNVGQCAANATLSVTVNPLIVPDFNTTLVLCNGSVAPVLNAVSPNGISGTWNPAIISNTVSGNYIFTPNAGQCATSTTLAVTITNSLTPDFATTITLCAGAIAPVLQSASPNGITGNWLPATINNMSSGNYTFTPNAGQCAANLTLNVTVNPLVAPDFVTAIPLCNGETAPILNNVSPNGISGTWNPAIISNTVSGNYTFTPNAGQCATSTTLAVTITNSLTPDFATTITLCAGAIAPVLQNASPNGITGSWSPATINNISSGNYTFTPNAGQCAANLTLNVTVNPLVAPDFNTTLVLCNGSVAPVLNAVSPNGISGTWNPATISNTTTGNYIFTPNPGQCASVVTLHVAVQNSIVPDFTTTLTICSGSPVPTLNNISPNGISGNWSPAVVGNTASGNYVFTPNAGQCAGVVTLSVTVNPATVPDFSTALHLCSGTLAPAFSLVSPNGINGTWFPTAIDSQISGTYTFTPSAGQCATNATVTVTVDPLPQPVLQDAFICIDQLGQVINPANLNTGLPNIGYTFVWQWNGNVLATTTHAHLATAPGHYEVTVTNQHTGCTAVAEADVNVLSGFVAQAVTGADFDNSGTITVLVTGGSGHYEFELDAELTQQNNQFFNVAPGQHIVKVKDLNGCAEWTLEVFLLDYPRFFTPNGDGYHDFWNIGGLSGQKDSKIYIFDRYGKLMKSLKPSDQSGWDGTYNGRELPSTDYWFELYYQDRSGSAKTFKSHFSLKR